MDLDRYIIMPTDDGPVVLPVYNVPGPTFHEVEADELVAQSPN